MKTGKLSILVVAAWLACPAVQGAEKRIISDSTVKVGDQAPNISLRDTNGKLIKLADIAYPEKKDQQEKHKVLLFFFRSDCPPCVNQFREIVASYQKYKDDIKFLMIAMLANDAGSPKLDQWLKENPAPFPVLVDTYESVTSKYVVKELQLVIPAIFLIDENGVIRAQMEGLRKDLESEIQKFLAGKSVQPAR